MIPKYYITVDQGYTDIANNIISKLNREKVIPTFGKSILPSNIFWVNRKIATAGMAYPKTRHIVLNMAYEKHDHFWNNTIAHEYAHIVCFEVYPHAKQGHGPEFRSICNLFGIKEDTYHDMKIEGRKKWKRWTIMCDCGWYNLTSTYILRKMNSINPMKCNNCKKEFVHRTENGNLLTTVMLRAKVAIESNNQ